MWIVASKGLGLLENRNGYQLGSSLIELIASRLNGLANSTGQA